MINATETPSALILETAKRLAEGIASRADQADREGRLPAQDIEDLKGSGYMHMVVPRELGGLGLPLVDCAAAHLELSKGSASTGIVAAMTVQIFGDQREQRTWSDYDFERFSADLLEGALFNSAASEPKLGSPSRGGFYATTAQLTEDGWRINGHKQWITGGQHLTHILVKLSIEGDGATILVPAGTPGLDWHETWGDSLSLRASDSDDLYLRDVVVPEENLLLRGTAKKGPNAWFPAILATVYLGAALAARDALIEYALERVPTALGKPIATLPKIQRQIGEIDARLAAARSLLMDAARQWDPKQRKHTYPGIVRAKQFATTTAAEVTQQVMRVAGAGAISKDLPLERYFRDAQAGEMHPPSGDTAYEMVGTYALSSYANGHG